MYCHYKQQVYGCLDLLDDSWAFTKYIFVPRSNTIFCMAFPWHDNGGGMDDLLLRNEKVRSIKKEYSLPLRMFKMKAATDLMKSGKVMKSKRGQPSTFVDTFYNVKKKQGPTTLISEPSTKNDNVGYFPSFQKRDHCKYQICVGYQKFYMKNVEFICALHQNQTAFTSFMCKYFDNTL